MKHRGWSNWVDKLEQKPQKIVALEQAQQDLLAPSPAVTLVATLLALGLRSRLNGRIDPNIADCVMRLCS